MNEIYKIEDTEHDIGDRTYLIDNNQFVVRHNQPL